ncbi:MAG: CoA ester lyase [Alicyclobacillaceae bacterium]|nr:CoA ester lyase [Alicyclobacillaceae bacterium]
MSRSKTKVFGPLVIRSFLIAPANRFDLVRNFLKYTADCYVMDLEDGTPESEKERGRQLVVEAVAHLRSGGLRSPLLVRVNPIASSHFDRDIAAVLNLHIDGIVLPKVETADEVGRLVERIESREDFLQPVRIVVGIETALGVQNVVEVCKASDYVSAVYFGAEDFAADMGAIRSDGGEEVLYARSRVVLGARLAGITAIDQAVVEIRDHDRFRRDAEMGRRLGYHGKICVHPAQAMLANEIFSPRPEEVRWAKRLLDAYEAAIQKGIGTIDFEGQMVDGPLLKRAQRIIAQSMGVHG